MYGSFYYFLLIPVVISAGLVCLVVGVYVFTGMSFFDSIEAMASRGVKLTCWHCKKETLANRKTCQHCGKELQ